LKILLEEWHNSGQSSNFNFIRCQKGDDFRIFSEGQIQPPLLKECAQIIENIIPMQMESLGILM